MRSNAIILEKHLTEIISPVAPFNFKGTVHKPSHFPIQTMLYNDNCFWQTFRLNEKMLGLKILKINSDSREVVKLSVFSNRSLTDREKSFIVQELRWRFGFDEDLSDFVPMVRKDIQFASVFEKWLGMRMTCFYSLYELLVITILLQNATIRRTTTMLQNLLERFGVKILFDGHELNTFWTPLELAEIEENELRVIGMGYRAKYLKSISEAFIDPQLSDSALRQLTTDKARRWLLKIKGIGPISAQIALIEGLKRYNALETIPQWEKKIYTKILFGDKEISQEELLTTIKNRWGNWSALAIHYLFEDLFWKHKSANISWLEELIRL